MEYIKLNLQYFAEGGDGGAAGDAGGAAEAAAAESTEKVEIQAGDTLPDGQKVSSQVAAAMNRQMKRNPELRKVYGQTPKAQEPAAPEAPAEKTPEDEWNEAKKGKYAEFYGRDVQAAIQDRFKNAVDQQAQLNKLEPMLKVLRDRAGVQDNDELIKQVMDDDSLYEEEASKAGMTVAAYKMFKQQEAKLAEVQQREDAAIRNQRMQQHFAGLQRQAEELKQIIPNFDLQKELQNKTFLNMTRPDVGVSVRDAYYAIHRNELEPNLLRAGMQRAKQQMAGTIQAQQARPVEGAMKGRGNAAAQVAVDPKKFTKEQREEIKRLAHLRGRVSLI